MLFLFRQSGLSKNALQRANGHVFAHIARDGDAAFLRWMGELAVASGGRYQPSAIGFQEFDNIAHLHSE